MGKNYKTGFTLIEILIVIAIIGALAAIIGWEMEKARAVARDGVRITEALEFQKAIELYFFDYGYFPSMLQPDGVTPVDEDPTDPAWHCTTYGDEDHILPDYDWSCSWTESYEQYFLWQLWDIANGGEEYLPFKLPDLFINTPDNRQWDYSYQYKLIKPGDIHPSGQPYFGGASGCPVDKGAFYVIGVDNLESIPGHNYLGRHAASSPGFTCGWYDAHYELEWATGGFASTTNWAQ